MQVDAVLNKFIYSSVTSFSFGNPLQAVDLDMVFLVGKAT